MTRIQYSSSANACSAVNVLQAVVVRSNSPVQEVRSQYIAKRWHRTNLPFCALLRDFWWSDESASEVLRSKIPKPKHILSSRIFRR